MTVPLPIWVLKNGSRVRSTKAESWSVSRGRLAAAPSMISGFLAARIISAARSSAAADATGSSTGWGGMIAGASTTSEAMSSGSSSSTGPGRSSMQTRKASRTIEGMVTAETICRAILVKGRIEATTSTIWNRAWRVDRTPFWPVRMIIGMAPRWA